MSDWPHTSLPPLSLYPSLSLSLLFSLCSCHRLTNTTTTTSSSSCSSFLAASLQGCLPYLVEETKHLEQLESTGMGRISNFRIFELISVGVGLSVSAAVGLSMLKARRNSRAAKDGLYVFGDQATAEMDAADVLEDDYPVE